MIVIAHRGASQEFFENSWAAFSRACDLGCHRIEMDLHLSQDGEVFILHDNETLRLCGEDFHIDQMRSQEIRKLRLKNGESIPTLQDVLQKLAPVIELNLELKGENTALCQVTAKAVSQLSNVRPIIFSSFYFPHLEQLRKNFPKLSAALLWGEDTLLADGSCPKDPWGLMKQLDAKIIHPQLQLVDKDFMRHAKKSGYLVYPWVSSSYETLKNCEKLWENLQGLGVAGLCTNYPKEMLAWLGDRHGR